MFCIVSPQILTLTSEAAECIAIRDELEALLEALTCRLLHVNHVLFYVLQLLTSLKELLLNVSIFSLQ